MIETWLDISIIKCPNCGKIYTDASWYVVELESDIQCSICKSTFNTKENILIRALIKIEIENNSIKRITVDRYLPVT